MKRPRRESPWGVILPLAFALLIAAAAGYGLLVRAGINEIRSQENGAEQPAPAQVGQQSVSEVVFPVIQAQPESDAQAENLSSAAADSSGS